MQTPAIVTTTSKRSLYRDTLPAPATPAVVTTAGKRGKAIVRTGTSDAAKASPAHDDRKPAIVTARRPKTSASIPPGLLADTPEEHRRRGDAADAMFQEMKRQIAAKERP